MICTIRNNTITLDDAVLFAAPESSFADFAKKALKALNVEYPKFFKMDNLSKLAFLAAEAVLSPLSAEAKSGTALLSLYSTAISRRLRSCKPIAKLFWLKA